MPRRVRPQAGQTDSAGSSQNQFLAARIDSRSSQMLLGAPISSQKLEKSILIRFYGAGLGGDPKVSFHHISSHLIMSHHILSCDAKVSSHHILSHLITSYLILSHLIGSHQISSTILSNIIKNPNKSDQF